MNKKEKVDKQLAATFNLITVLNKDEEPEIQEIKQEIQEIQNVKEYTKEHIYDMIEKVSEMIDAIQDEIKYNPNGQSLTGYAAVVNAMVNLLKILKEVETDFKEKDEEEEKEVSMQDIINILKKEEIL